MGRVPARLATSAVVALFAAASCGVALAQNPRVGEAAECRTNCMPADRVLCQDGLFCITPASQRGGNGTCTKLETRQAAGESQECKFFVQPELRVPCQDGLECVDHPLLDGSGTCQKQGRLGAGDNKTCKMTVSPAFQIPCKKGLVCMSAPKAGASGICKEPFRVGLGEACQIGDVAPAEQIHCNPGLDCTVPSQEAQEAGEPSRCQPEGGPFEPPVVDEGQDSATGPMVVGEGYECLVNFDPQHRVVCEEGLVCITPPGLGASSGICRKPSFAPVKRLVADAFVEQPKVVGGRTAADEPKQPAVVGEGRECKMTVAPADRIRCDQGLVCIAPPHLGTSGVCSKAEDASMKRPTVVGQGQECKLTVGPHEQVYCEAGLACVTQSGFGASGVCQ